MNEGVGGGDGRKLVSFFSSLPRPRSFIGAIFRAVLVLCSETARKRLLRRPYVG